MASEGSPERSGGPSCRPVADTLAREATPAFWGSLYTAWRAVLLAGTSGGGVCRGVARAGPRMRALGEGRGCGVGTTGARLRAFPGLGPPTPLAACVASTPVMTATARTWESAPAGLPASANPRDSLAVRRSGRLVVGLPESAGRELAPGCRIHRLKRGWRLFGYRRYTENRGSESTKVLGRRRGH